MNTNTKYFGEIQYEKEDLLCFPEGLFGFETHKEFLPIHFDPENEGMLCLQSMVDENLAFIIANPFSILPGYEPVLTSEDMKALELDEDSAVSFYVLCVLRDTLDESTANMKSPIAINPATRQARQVILENPTYTFRYPLKSQKKEEGHC